MKESVLKAYLVGEFNARTLRPLLTDTRNVNEFHRGANL